MRLNELSSTIVKIYFTVQSVEGPNFNISKVNRLHMGFYLCIASNGVPPSVSKRIMLTVQCKYILPIAN